MSPGIRAGYLLSCSGEIPRFCRGWFSIFRRYRGMPLTTYVPTYVYRVLLTLSVSLIRASCAPPPHATDASTPDYPFPAYFGHLHASLPLMTSAIHQTRPFALGLAEIFNKWGSGANLLVYLGTYPRSLPFCGNYS